MTLSLLDKNFNSLEDLYYSLCKEQDSKFEAEILFFLRNWFLDIVIFDEKSGKSVTDDLDNFILKLSNVDMNENTKDYISRITDHSSEALQHIFKSPREKILREHDIIPIYAVREVDSSTIQWLSRRSGRNIREKLAEKSYLKAVKRRFSLDTTENRLVKAFVYRLESLLVIKEDLKIDENGNSELLQMIERWLRNDMPKEIGNWSNFPPNNTLLQDKHYRKVWDSWLWIQNIDSLVTKDSKNYKKNFLTLIFWTLLSELNKYTEISLLQQPIYTNYDDFSISSVKKVSGILRDKEKYQKVLCDYVNNKVKISVNNTILFLSEIVENGKIKIIMGNNIEHYEYRKDDIFKIKKDFSDLIVRKYELSLREALKRKNIFGNRAILELNDIYPRFIIDDTNIKRTPFRFVTQYWKNKDDQVNLDCSRAKAMYFGNDVVTVSPKNLFTKEILENKTIFSTTLNKFTKEIAAYIQVDNLQYLVSDSVNEFESEKLRKSMNFSFRDAEAIPRSIASVFYWQSMEEFSRFNISEKDIVIVIEASSEDISMTKLIPCKNNKLVLSIPETKGVTWERHPSVSLKRSKPKNVFKKVLKEEFSKDITSIWGREGFILDSQKLAWLSDDEEWFINDGKIKLDNIYIDFKDINSIFNLKNQNNVKLIVIGEYAKQLKINKSINSSINYSIIELGEYLLEGARQLAVWQKQVEKFEIALWEDHLPELSFNIPQDGRYQDFYLVKKTTIVPKKGKKTEIKIKSLLTLPKGRNFYEFPLQLGSGNQELEFIAYLSSSVLPFSKDMLCELKMVYTYGADEPYELYFIPHNNEDYTVFKSIKVQWKEFNKSFVKESPAPGFPDAYGWKDLEKFPSKSGGYSDLFEWMGNNIKMIQSIYNTGVVAETINSDWIDKGDNNIFAFTKENTFMHQSELHTQNIPNKGDRVSFYKIEKEKFKYSAYGIVEEGKYPKIDFLRVGLRFPVLTMWNYGHSLSDNDVPDDFRIIMKKGITVAIALFDNTETPNNLKKELLFFLSVMHCDTDIKIVDVLEKGLKENKYSREIAYAIGDAKLSWQKRLLIDSIMSFENISILSIALWRSKVLIHHLTEAQINILLDLMLKRFKKFEKELNSNNILELIKYLELLYALLRTRESQDENIKIILAVNNNITKELTNSIEKITNILLDKNLLIVTRINFSTIQKLEAFNKTPDLLYALRMYLTGDDGANSIHVSEIENE